MTAELPHDRAALIAASQASEAVTELLRFHIEGPAGRMAFGQVEVLEKLAEALLHAARIEIDTLAADSMDAEYREELGQIASACARFIEGWAG
jgi:hypothetical protein